MNSVDYITIAIGAYLLIVGLASIFTGKVFSMGGAAAKYTDESLKKYSLPLGLSNVLSGIGLILFHILDGELFKIGDFSVSIGMAILVAVIIICIVIYFMGKKVLVKK